MRWTGVVALVLGTAVGLANAEDSVKLDPPEGSTKELRVEHMFTCLAAAQDAAKLAPKLGAFERAPLRGQETGRFLGRDRPAAEDDAIPIRYSSALGVNWGQSVVSDRYVLCLLAIGYRWPPPIASGLAGNVAADGISLELESGLLFNAAVAYQKRGILPEAQRLLRRALELEEGVSGPESEKTLRRVGQLSILYFQRERFDEGIPLVRRLLSAAPGLPAQGREMALSISDNYARELRKRNQEAEASDLEARAAALRR